LQPSGKSRSLAWPLQRTLPMPNEEGSSGARPRSAMVMIIDDDAEMRAMLRDFLMSEGFRVREAPTGDLVINSLESEEPAAVVLDKEMPGVNGLDILAYVQHRRPSIPVILITAFGGPEVRAEALRRGAAHYIEKPFRVGALLAAVRAAVEGGAEPPPAPSAS
jgi:DNA-binding NtrC family response regulator